MGIGIESGVVRELEEVERGMKIGEREECESRR